MLVCTFQALLLLLLGFFQLILQFVLLKQLSLIILNIDVRLFRFSVFVSACLRLSTHVSSGAERQNTLREIQVMQEHVPKSYRRSTSHQSFFSFFFSCIICSSVFVVQFLLSSTKAVIERPRQGNKKQLDRTRHFISHRFNRSQLNIESELKFIYLLMFYRWAISFHEFEALQDFPCMFLMKQWDIHNFSHILGVSFTEILLVYGIQFCFLLI